MIKIAGNQVSFACPKTLEKEFDSIVKIRGYHSRSEAIRKALMEFIEREKVKIPIMKIIRQIARGEIPDFLEANNLDYRKKKDLDTLETMLKNQVEK